MYVHNGVRESFNKKPVNSSDGQSLEVYLERRIHTLQYFTCSSVSFQLLN